MSTERQWIPILLTTLVILQSLLYPLSDTKITVTPLNTSADGNTRAIPDFFGVGQTIDTHKGDVNCVEYSPNGGHLASVSDDGTLKIWNTSTMKLLRNIDVDLLGVIQCVCWSGNGSWIAVGYDSPSPEATAYIKVFDINNGKCNMMIDTGSKNIYSLAWGDGGSRIAAALQDKTVVIWDTAEWTVEATLCDHTQPVHSLAWSHNGNKFATGCWDFTIKIWDPVTWKCIRTLSEHTEPVECISWSPDDTRLASGSDDQSIRIWDTYEWNAPFTYNVHTHWVTDLAWSPDGSRLASVSCDNTLQICNPYNGVRFQSLIKHNDVVRSVDWSPKGDRIATGSDDSTVQIWSPDGDSDGTCDDKDDFPDDPAATLDSDHDGSPDTWTSGAGPDDSTMGLELDHFPLDPAASRDTDGDGFPDEWNEGMSEKDSTTIPGLRLDDIPLDPAASLDSDRDGWPDEWNEGCDDRDSTMDLHIDAFPEDAAARSDTDGDGYPDNWCEGKNAFDSVLKLALDAFPGDSAAAIDTDGDGYPDRWNPGMNETNSNNRLILDVFPTDLAAGLDTDGDGYPDVWNNGFNETHSTLNLTLDAFPVDAAASMDSDWDGFPDTWNLGYDQDDSTSEPELRIDDFPNDPSASLDSDRDGCPDVWNQGVNSSFSTSMPPLRLDDYPDDPAASMDSDGDGHPDCWNDGMTGTNSTSTPKLHLDRFPLDPAASSDRDGDGYPERWNEEYDEQDSITGLKLDLFPDDPGEWRDSDWPMGDGVGDRGDFLPGLHNILFYSIIALTMVLGLILLLIVQRKRQKRLVDWLFSMDVIDADEQINGRLLKDIRLLRDKWTDFKCDNKFKLAHEMNRNELNRTREKINRFNKMAHHGTQASHAAEQVIGKLSEQSDMLSGRGNQLYCLKEKYDMAIHELEDEVRLYILNAKSNQTSADEIRQILERADRRKNDIQRQLAEITSTRPQHVKAETPPQVSSSPHNYPNVQYPRHDTVIPRAQPPQPSEPVESAGEPSSSAGTTTGFRPKYSPDHHTPAHPEPVPVPGPAPAPAPAPAPPPSVEEAQSSLFTTSGAVQCSICLGYIKNGAQAYKCVCSKIFHPTCGTRTGKCPICQRSITGEDVGLPKEDAPTKKVIPKVIPVEEPLNVSWRSDPRILGGSEDFNITDIFLIGLDGLLIRSMSFGTSVRDGTDQDIMTGMLTAVTDFIRDSFRDERGGLKTLQYGRMTIYLERGVTFYIVTVFRGEPPGDLRRRMRNTLIQLWERYKHYLKAWDGTHTGLEGIDSCIMESLGLQSPPPDAPQNGGDDYQPPKFKGDISTSVPGEGEMPNVVTTADLSTKQGCFHLYNMLLAKKGLDIRIGLNSTRTEVNTARKQIITLYHPDKWQTDKGKATFFMQKVNVAWEVLSRK